jgi:hypothetical protein
VPAENASPERALGVQVSRVEHDHLTHHIHDTHSMGVSAGRVDRTSSAGTMAGPELLRGQRAAPRLFVGSGAIGAGCKAVIRQRLKLSGMGWTVPAALG